MNVEILRERERERQEGAMEMERKIYTRDIFEI